MSLVDGDYVPDPPSSSKFRCEYVCDKCGSIYQAYIKCDRLHNCRNLTCNGTPWRVGRKPVVEHDVAEDAEIVDAEVVDDEGSETHEPGSS